MLRIHLRFTAAAISGDAEALHYLRLRREYLRRGDGAGESPQPRCSVLVERVPPRLRSDAARPYFAALFGHGMSIQPCPLWTVLI